MSRPIFFTGRKEIVRSDVAIRLLERRGSLSRFEARIELSRYNLPPEADVVVEAYNNAYFERFIVGAVKELGEVCGRELKELEPGDRPHFRVKVINRNDTAVGQLLAAIDEVRPATDDENGAAGALLPLIPKTRSVLGDEFWRVHFVSSDELRPELWINNDVSDLFRKLQNQDPTITSLIMPEVMRQVLNRLVAGEVVWTDDGVLGQWLRLAKEFHPDEFDDWDAEALEASSQSRRDWVDAVVKQFALMHRFFDRYHDQSQAITEQDNDD